MSRAFFSSRLLLILSVLGIAVGTGNIWRFPRVAAQNAGDEGAGAFLVAWVVFLLVWSIPLIIAEYVMGRESRRGPVGAFVHFAGRHFAWMGGFVALVATAIMFYYSVVAGWCLHYFLLSLWEAPPQSTAAAMGNWEGFQAGVLPLVFHMAALGICGFCCFRGVRTIERANLVLVPVLVAVVLVCLGRALTLDGAWDGVRFLFTFQPAQLLEPRLWLEALTQNAWDTGAGWGLILVYAVYMRRQMSPVGNACITATTNNLISLLAAMTIFGTVFALLSGVMSRGEMIDLMRESGPGSTGLTFIWMPLLFDQLPFGRVFASLFFLGLSFAALSSLIAMVELAARVLVDAGFQRSRALPGVLAVGFLFGAPSALNPDFLANQDFVWGVALMISGAFIAFATVRYGLLKLARDMRERENRWGRLWVKVWPGFMLVLVPAQALILLSWWIWLSATTYAPDNWYDPFEPYSVMTCLAQWGIALAILLMLNRKLANSLAQTEPDVDMEQG